MSTLFELATRRRLPFLLATLVAGLLLVTGIELAGDLLSGILFATALVLYLGLIAVATAALSYHPRQLVERPGELATVDSPAPVLIAAGLTLLATGLVADNVGDWRAGDDLDVIDLTLSVLWPLALAFSWYSALGSFGVSLKSDGLHERRPFTTLFVPWDALDPEIAAEPGSQNTVKLHLRHPEAAARRGLPGSTSTLRSPTDAAYLAGVINSAVSTRAARR